MLLRSSCFSPSRAVLLQPQLEEPAYVASTACITQRPCDLLAVPRLRKRERSTLCRFRNREHGHPTACKFRLRYTVTFISQMRGHSYRATQGFSIHPNASLAEAQKEAPGMTAPRHDTRECHRSGVASAAKLSKQDVSQPRGSLHAGSRNCAHEMQINADVIASATNQSSPMNVVERLQPGLCVHTVRHHNWARPF